MDRPNRPRCLTCPFWSGDTDTNNEEEEGHCERHPPAYTGEHGNGAQTLEPICWDQPVTTARETCGEHPDSPDYIASLKKDEPWHTTSLE